MFVDVSSTCWPLYNHYYHYYVPTTMYRVPVYQHVLLVYMCNVVRQCGVVYGAGGVRPVCRITIKYSTIQQP